MREDESSVSDRPGGDPQLTAAQAQQELREITTLGDRARRITHRGVSRTPMLVWGLAWVLGYGALDLLGWPRAAPVGLVIAALAVLTVRVTRSQQIVSGWEHQLTRAWWALMACSPLLVAVISPTPLRTILVFLGALWGTGILLLAAACSDRGLAGVGVVIVVTATAVQVFAVGHGLLVLGLAGGVAMGVLGALRTREVR